MHLDFISKAINFFVPKFHLPAHIEKCQTTFSFNFKRGVGCTDGEALERGWANINPVASSTKEMGPGARRDMLDDFFGDWNWKKIVGLDQWRSQVEAWEDDPCQPNPFERNADTLAKEEEIEIHSGACLTLHEDCSPSVLISSGLELEEHQQRLRADKARCGLHVTDTQQGKLLERSNALQRRIDAWVKIQELYMPNIAAIRLSDKETSADTTSVPTSKTFKLWLPSEIGRLAPCDERLQRMEWRLRHAQGHDALRSLRSSLRAQTAVLKYKDRNLRGQGANTRARSTLKTIDARIEAAASRYEGAHKALVILGGLLNVSGWQSSLRPLNRKDIRSMSDLLWGESEGRRKLSWIWNMRGAGGSEKDDSGALEDMRIEWCKARARAMRWGEEVELLREEMCCIVAFLMWEAGRWDERQDGVIPTSMEHRDGKRDASMRGMHQRAGGMHEPRKRDASILMYLVDTKAKVRPNTSSDLRAPAGSSKFGCCCLYPPGFHPGGYPGTLYRGHPGNGQSGAKVWGGVWGQSLGLRLTRRTALGDINDLDQYSVLPVRISCARIGLNVLKCIMRNTIGIRKQLENSETDAKQVEYTSKTAEEIENGKQKTQQRSGLTIIILTGFGAEKHEHSMLTACVLAGGTMMAGGFGIVTKQTRDKNNSNSARVSRVCRTPQTLAPDSAPDFGPRLARSLTFTLYPCQALP
ncbi:uncharacterized protein HD556DRAFT_1538926 [Suillus plorans]|uniref:Uncharacterized protein n=1 Tax=Suillus plorans TaxID=116603 RepID=A0A9P7AGN7_9AGAM|nr:uncharacterized protein HD556DRAFT_1538926 [Suillus plorans]KAG1787941.1 hypothetical protein HD556DRAFT_1538926 [Suillus plorans]